MPNFRVKVPWLFLCEIISYASVHIFHYGTDRLVCRHVKIAGAIWVRVYCFSGIVYLVFRFCWRKGSGVFTLTWSSFFSSLKQNVSNVVHRISKGSGYPKAPRHAENRALRGCVVRCTGHGVDNWRKREEKVISRKKSWGLWPTTQRWQVDS